MSADLHQNPSSGPVLQLLSRGLQLWLRSQCEAIDTLELELLGSGRELLRGRLAGVRVRARGVTYRQLTMAAVELTSTPLELSMAPLWRGRTPVLQQPFRITGTARFDSAGLNRSLAGEPWRQLGDQLIRELLQGAERLSAPPQAVQLQQIRLEGQQLTLIAAAAPSEPPAEPAVAEVPVQLQLEASCLHFHRNDGPGQGSLPLDPSLRIAAATVIDGTLLLAGEAAVTPG